MWGGTRALQEGSDPPHFLEFGARDTLHESGHLLTEREFFIDNLLVRIHFIIVMIR